MATDTLLLSDIKNHLGITWQDEDEDRKIKSYMELGINFLNGKYGEPADYHSAGLPRTLLFEFCRYMRDGASDVFEQNYLNLIIAMQNEKKVRDYESCKSVQGSP